MVDQIRHWLVSYRTASSPVVVGLALAIPVLSFLAGLVVILALPPNYFVRPKPQALVLQNRRVFRLTLLAAKNVAGSLIFLVGLVMALPLVPGPGVLFMLIGLGLIDFPGKRALELRLLRQRHVLSSVNKVRVRFGKRPLLSRESEGESVVERNP